MHDGQAAYSDESWEALCEATYSDAAFVHGDDVDKATALVSQVARGKSRGMDLFHAWSFIRMGESITENSAQTRSVKVECDAMTKLRQPVQLGHHPHRPQFATIAWISAVDIERLFWLFVVIQALSFRCVQRQDFHDPISP